MYVYIIDWKSNLRRNEFKKLTSVAYFSLVFCLVINIEYNIVFEYVIVRIDYFVKSVSYLASTWKISIFKNSSSFMELKPKNNEFSSKIGIRRASKRAKFHQIYKNLSRWTTYCDYTNVEQEYSNYGLRNPPSAMAFLPITRSFPHWICLPKEYLRSAVVNREFLIYIKIVAWFTYLYVSVGQDVLMGFVRKLWLRD